MVEIGESSFTYLQIFYSLDYDIPLLSYKILCWVLALILHLGVLLRTIFISNLNLSFFFFRCLPTMLLLAQTLPTPSLSHEPL